MAECSRRGCKRVAVVDVGKTTSYCNLHYRSNQMRDSASAKGKIVPNQIWLERELIRIELAGMICPHCSIQMQWSGAGSRKNTITLQHDFSGDLRLLCLSCNVKHSNHGSDDYYQLLPGENHCARCHQVFPEDSFPSQLMKDGTRKKRSYCRGCRAEYDRQRKLKKKKKSKASKAKKELTKKLRWYFGYGGNDYHHDSDFGDFGFDIGGDVGGDGGGGE